MKRCISLLIARPLGYCGDGESVSAFGNFMFAANIGKAV